MTEFHDPLWLLLLLLIPAAVIAGLLWGKKRKIPVRFPSLSVIKKTGGGKGAKLRHILKFLRAAAVILLIIALARPQKLLQSRHTETEGIDIMLALDISTSMLAEDFRPKNRLEAAKKVASEFIDGRTSDQIGLVVFAGQSFTQCPLTLDYDLLKQLLERIRIEMVTEGMIEDGTAIGMAIGNGVNRLRASQAKSRILILLTDGQNNRGEIDPLTASSAAQVLGIRVYTIGVGTQGLAPYPVRDQWGRTSYQQVQVEIDEELLRQIADQTGGKYFRATDAQALRRVYTEIDKLEKSKIRVHQYRQKAELFASYIGWAVLFLLIEIILSATRLRTMP
ncbi:aerotolerance regulator BatA [candidate division LCP-89 bacterium B3_LCP]|uniref:Aerotolerance regulator BatA n=1 Tax=candidate division LCP-89 bacterium B3_LCP TaxID=2012998 RepID=A0A532V568_UNCL8|nr:MAG: aerotolerance regulator BatA [candidate division LCP-89 bacterium B3_LCP]